MKSNKEILKGALPNLSITFLLIIIIALFALSFLQAATLIITYSLIMGIYKITKEGFSIEGIRNLIFSMGVIVLVLGVINFINETFGFNPLLSFFLVGFFIAFVVLFTRRKELMAAIRLIEIKHFGGTMEEKRERNKRK